MLLLHGQPEAVLYYIYVAFCVGEDNLTLFRVSVIIREGIAEFVIYVHFLILVLKFELIEGGFCRPGGVVGDACTYENYPVVEAEHALGGCRPGTEVLPVTFRVCECKASVLAFKRGNARKSGLVPFHKRPLERVLEKVERQVYGCHSRISVPVPAGLSVTALFGSAVVNKLHRAITQIASVTVVGRIYFRTPDIGIETLEGNHPAVSAMHSEGTVIIDIETFRLDVLPHSLFLEK